MKVKNYNKGNYLDIFDCVVYGEIKMTQKEWKEAKTYLLKCKSDSWYKSILKEDLNKEDKYAQLYDNKYDWRNIRVSYTQKLFEKYNLPRYKQQNYVIKIIKQ